MLSGGNVRKKKNIFIYILFLDVMYFVDDVCILSLFIVVLVFKLFVLFELFSVLGVGGGVE